VRVRQRALRMDGRDGNLLAEAAVRVGFISPDGRPRRQPAAWRAAFDTLHAKDAA
jgi:acyl-CoA thioester hydrolase